MSLWSPEKEVDFFRSSLKAFATKEQLFYSIGGNYYAYIPKGLSSEGRALNSRNALIGSYTEKWCGTLFTDIANELGLHAVNGVICKELGLTGSSAADLALCTTSSIEQKSENIKLIFEIKMSIISNYQFLEPDTFNLIGDYNSHKGNPSLLRSDSMLKAIGKALNIRVSCPQSASIPIIILGNSPITGYYSDKVDYLKQSGVLQGFWSLYPNPTKDNFIKETAGKGFITISETSELLPLCQNLVEKDLHFFSSMMSKKEIGRIIKAAGKENTDIARAERFLQLLKG